MKLLFQRPFKSIRNLEAVELPDFVVLTGVNGAGKSHLLEAIENGSINIEGVQPNDPNHAQRRPIRRFDANTLITQDTGAFSGGHMMQEVTGHWDHLNNTRKGQLDGMYMGLRGVLPDVDRWTPREIFHFDEQKLVDRGVEPHRTAEVLASIKSVFEAYESAVTSQFVQPDPANRPRLAEKLKEANGLPLLAMDQEDFFGAFPTNWQQIDLFQHSFSRMFSNYQRAWRENELRARGRESGANLVAYTPDEFLIKHGAPPWDFLNNLLEVAKLDFRINQPAKWEDRPYEPILQDLRRGNNVKFADLSSGERILMSFALCLYHVQDAREILEYPKVLLFDEIDAPLHPSMASSLLRTIQDALVVGKGIKVILTTHSPSTVALSPEGSVYVMQKDGSKRVVSASRDSALGILTAGVPTLSVNYENRRQVFVESKYDVGFYGALYQLIRSKLLPEISISFIASGGGGGNGNCDQVVSIASVLRNSGNRTIVGLIDWDLKNKPTEHVQVLGVGARYALDNYILDPIAVGLFLMREKYSPVEEFGFTEGESYLSIAQSSPEVLAKIARKVTSDLSKNLKQEERAESDDHSFNYSEGFSIIQPRWLAVIQGHRLEAVLKETYPPLLRFRGEPDLKNEIIKKVLTDRPGLIPSEVLWALREVQETR